MELNAKLSWDTLIKRANDVVGEGVPRFRYDRCGDICERDIRHECYLWLMSVDKLGAKQDFIDYVENGYFYGEQPE